MLESLFTWMSGLVEASFPVALMGAFLWGVLSILLSPCHLTSIPLVVGTVSHQGVKTYGKAFRTSFAFAFGILISIGLIGVVTALLGRMLGDVGRWSNYVVAVIFLLVGLYLLEIIRLELPGMGQLTSKGKGAWAALVLGLVFGIALGPCTFAFMAPVLAITLFSPESGVVKDIALLTAYGIGHCLLIVLAGTFTAAVQKYLNWNERSKGALILKKICGVLIIIGAVYLIFN